MWSAVSEEEAHFPRALPCPPRSTLPGPLSPSAGSDLGVGRMGWRVHTPQPPGKAARCSGKATCLGDGRSDAELVLLSSEPLWVCFPLCEMGMITVPTSQSLGAQQCSAWHILCAQ